MRLFIGLFGLALLLLMAAVSHAQDDSGVLSSPFPDDALRVLIAARNDLELLATNQLGGERPVGWSGSLDVTNPQLAVLLRLDLELLMARLLGMGQVPNGWFGASPSTPFAIARDIRHDLELLADLVVAANVRPPGWAGDDPLMRCDRATQNLVLLLERSGLFSLAVDPNSESFCAQATRQASAYVENSVVTVTASGAPAAAAAPAVDRYRAATAFALAYLDRNAIRRVGTIPPDASFTPVARSYTQFSNMVVVRGDDFEVFVDFTTTTIPRAVFAGLPDVNSIATALNCRAPWCAG